MTTSEQKENRSARRSRRMLRQAFQELLEEKEFRSITVLDIVRRADLNRSTFYAHYPDIYGLVDEMQEEIFQKHLEIFRRIEFRSILRDPTPYLACITGAMEENTALLRRLGLSESLQQRSDRFQELMEHDIMNHSDIPPEVRSSAQFAVRVHFFMGGIMNTYRRWSMGKLSCTQRELSDQIALMIQQTATGFLETDWMQSL